MTEKKSENELRAKISQAHSKLINRRLQEIEDEKEIFSDHLSGEKQLFPEKEFLGELESG